MCFTSAVPLNDNGAWNCGRQQMLCRPSSAFISDHISFHGKHQISARVHIQ